MVSGVLAKVSDEKYVVTLQITDPLTGRVARRVTETVTRTLEPVGDEQLLRTVNQTAVRILFEAQQGIRDALPVKITIDFLRFGDPFASSLLSPLRRGGGFGFGDATTTQQALRIRAQIMNDYALSAASST